MYLSTFDIFYISYVPLISTKISISIILLIMGVPGAESSRSVRGMGKGVSGKPYHRLCNVRRPRLGPGTFRSHAVRLYRLHQARPFVDHLTCCRCFTTDSLPRGFPRQFVRASAYAELDGERKRQSIYPGSGPRSLIE